MEHFSSLGLSPAILKALPELGIEHPTEIQKQAIPVLLSGARDFIGLAQTGTGKTAAFGLPLCDLVDGSADDIQALILSPTRELGQQIAAAITSFARYQTKLNVLSVYGGANIQTQIRKLKERPHIIIATPGRLIDLLKRKALSLGTLKYIVLDEADEMLNMGFKEDLDTILSHAPEGKTVWLFSATMPQAIRKIAQTYMKDPFEVRIDSQQKVNKNISHQFAVMKASQKIDAISRIMDMSPELRGLVFCRTKRETQQLMEQLRAKGYGVEALHGDLSQAQRDQAMRTFKRNKLQLMIATDVAARGLDINDLNLVIHNNLPEDAASYTHRSGRTARAGKSGISLALVTASEKGKLKGLQRQLQIDFQPYEVPEKDAVVENRLMQWAESVLSVDDEHKIDKKLEEKIQDAFGDLSKSAIIMKLVQKELAQIKEGFETSTETFDDDFQEDRPRRRERDRGGRGDRGERGERGGRDRKPRERSDRRSDRSEGRRKIGSGERERRSGSQRPTLDSKDDSRFFINIGTMDGVNQKDLKEFIAEQSNTPAGDIRQLDLAERHAFFTASKKEGKKIMSSFKGLRVEGRPIRVNEDTPD